MTRIFAPFLFQNPATIFIIFSVYFFHIITIGLIFNHEET